MADRFFRALAVDRDLHFSDLNDWESWDPTRIMYRNDAEVRWLMRTRAAARRIIRTVVELGTAIDESADSRIISLYVGESLLHEARSRWESMKQKRVPSLAGGNATPETET